jgi:hypothetical protein
VSIVKIENALEGIKLVTGLLAVIREMAVELKRANRLDDQALDCIEQRAILKLTERAFDSDARAHEAEQPRLVNISLDGLRFALVLVRRIGDDGNLV